MLISLASHRPTLTLEPGSKPQPALWLILEVVNNSLLCSDADFSMLAFLRREFPLVQRHSSVRQHLKASLSF